jgi:hypothetical protein
MMKRYGLFIFLITLFCISICFAQKAKQTDTSVGDIAFDANVDDPKFQFCNPSFVFQGYEVRNTHDEIRKWISSQLKEKFVFNDAWKNEKGFITVRFAVNCFGLTDRFRVMGVTKDLQSVIFPPDLNQHLTKLVKEIKWPVEHYKLQAVDYYQDVTFKIENGKLKDVLL